MHCTNFVPLLAVFLAFIAEATGRIHRRDAAYDIPANNGGSQLDESAGLGEPLNIIISALSSPKVLTDSGIISWANSIKFATECLGIHLGGPEQANLGDGRGWQGQTAVIRYDYGDKDLGTCLESLEGGNHFRFWRQSTTGAYFLAASVEESAEERHTIAPNGYDNGRDKIVQAATAGTTNANGLKYNTTAEYVTGLLQPGTQGINHNISIDGRVAVLTIRLV